MPKFIGKGLRTVNYKIGFPPDTVKILKTLTAIGLTGTKAMDIRGIQISPREFLAAYLSSVPVEPTDTCALKIHVIGKKGNQSVKYTYDLLSEPCKKWGLGGVSLITGLPVSIAAQMLAKRDRDERRNSPRSMHRT